MIRKFEMERFSLSSSKPFDQVVAALDASVGHPNMAEFARSTREARSFAELKSAVENGSGDLVSRRISLTLMIIRRAPEVRGSKIRANSHLTSRETGQAPNGVVGGLSASRK